jgi:hypothetical protein
MKILKVAGLRVWYPGMVFGYGIRARLGRRDIRVAGMSIEKLGQSSWREDLAGRH